MLTPGMRLVTCLSALFVSFILCFLSSSKNADVAVMCFSCDAQPFLKIMACCCSLIFAFALERTYLFEKGKTIIVRVTALLLVELCCVWLFVSIPELPFIVYCTPNMLGHVSH